MIAGTNSGSGKTTVVCGILQSLKNKQNKVMSYKCGPDYIDPMFHSRILGIKSRNLDSNFCADDVLRGLIAKNSADMDISVVEGVMGLYDGVGVTKEGSSYEIACKTGTPIVLVVDCSGMGGSVMAVLKGFLEYDSEHLIKGVIFNKLAASLYPEVSRLTEEMGVKSLGYFPKVKGAEIGSRHLGLITAAEIDDFHNKMKLLAENTDKYIDLEVLNNIADGAEMIDAGGVAIYDNASFIGQSDTCRDEKVRIAVAKDEAFCFYYEDNLDLLRELGCEIVEFSPLKDTELPSKISGLYIGGGYPELYASKLENNASMRDSIRNSIVAGLPTHAECGGFMYLHDFIRDIEGNSYKMAGVIKGECCFTDKLQHFGYAKMTANKDNLLCKEGESIKVHEFHRCCSSAEADVFTTVKRDKIWNSYVSDYNMAAGFPHIHYYANVDFAKNFVNKCREYSICLSK